MWVLGLSWGGIDVSSEINKLLAIEREAEELIKKARDEASKIIEEAKREAHTIIEEAEKAEFKELEEKIEKEIRELTKKISEEYDKMAEEVRSRGLSKLDDAVEYIIRRVLE
ncbi:hypothetical protein DRN84_01305 [Candidatus Geothermarchaeota archaeon]|nr:MAG: hypothetical protein DRN87_02850 [Candidatus Geothermarchaeota archaeon]RLG62663.1 MAG: hypothetical protein DRN84_01305 [Candidatus Geothermarchaeota archaeon]HEW93163.1 hypothetical protein [Thermoprotei archaeon]